MQQLLDFPLLINYACVLLGLYVLLESIDPIRSMAGGMAHLCHKLKYLAALTMAALTVYLGLKLLLSIYWLMMIGTIALFVWPRTVFRFLRWVNEALDEMDLMT